MIGWLFMTDDVIPYFETNLGKIFQGDCVEVLSKLDINFDLCLTDPPYIIGDSGGGGAFGSKKREYHRRMNNERETLKAGFDFELLNLISTKMKNFNAYFFCNKNLLCKLLEKYKDYNFDILTLHKTNPTPMCNNKYLSDTEYILFVRDSGVKLYGRYDTKCK
jgi:site-specific DNA-methyltransferase (adenine-specific)